MLHEAGNGFALCGRKFKNSKFVNSGIMMIQ